jgi:phosphatidate cytidylyltransferase
MFFKEELSLMSELQKRMISAALGALLIVNSIYWSEWTYFAIFFGICMFSLLEFYKLLGLDGNLPLRTFGTLNGLLLFSLSFFIERFDLNTKYYFLCAVSLTGIYFIKLYVKRDLKPFANIAFTFLGIIYVAVPFSLINVSIFFKQTYSYQVILGTMLILWASDAGAYFAGRRFGKRKLFYRISPKKTWEGSIGGGLAALFIGYAFSHLFTDLPLWKWLCISVIIAVAGTYGDLVESLFKRSINIKDSGGVIPGHGGFLDRFDSLLLSAPFITAFIKILIDFN